MAGRFTIALALEGQLRLDDQPAFHQAVASLQTRLGAAAIPLLHFPQHTTAAALMALLPLVRPDVVLHGRESRLFAYWSVAAESFPQVFSQFRRGLEHAPEPPLPPADLTGLGGSWDDLPQAWLRLAHSGPPPAAGGGDPCSAFPFRGARRE